MLSMGSYIINMKKIQYWFYLVFLRYFASFLDVFSCSVRFCAFHFLTLFLLLSGCVYLDFSPFTCSTDKGSDLVSRPQGESIEGKKKLDVVHM